MRGMSVNGLGLEANFFCIGVGLYGFGLSILTPFLASTLASGTKPVGLVNISVKT